MTRAVLIQSLLLGGVVAALPSGVVAAPQAPKVFAVTVERGFASDTARGATVGGINLDDRVIAAIDGEPITLSDLRAFARTQGQSLPPNGAGLRSALRELIIARLLDEEAKSVGAAASDADVAAYLEQIKAQNRLDDKGFEARLSSKGITKAVYLDSVRSDIARSRFISSHFRSKLAVTDEDLEQYFSRNPEQRPSKGTVHLQQISLAPGQQAQAEEIRAHLKKGGSWSEVGGEGYLDLGYIAPKDLRAELQQPAESLAPGEISEVIATEQGVYLLGVIDRSAEEAVVSEEIRDRVRGELLQGKLKSELERFITVELPQKYLIEMKL